MPWCRTGRLGIKQLTCTRKASHALPWAPEQKTQCLQVVRAGSPTAAKETFALHRAFTHASSYVLDVAVDGQQAWHACQHNKHYLSPCVQGPVLGQLNHLVHLLPDRLGPSLRTPPTFAASSAYQCCAGGSPPPSPHPHAGQMDGPQLLFVLLRMHTS